MNHFIIHYACIIHKFKKKENPNGQQPLGENASLTHTLYPRCLCSDGDFSITCFYSCPVLRSGSFSPISTFPTTEAERNSIKKRDGSRQSLKIKFHTARKLNLLFLRERGELSSDILPSYGNQDQI